MYRGMLSLLILLAPVVMTFAVIGCDQETKSVERTEEQRESPPQMVSPGEPVLE